MIRHLVASQGDNRFVELFWAHPMLYLFIILVILSIALTALNEWAENRWAAACQETVESAADVREAERIRRIEEQHKVEIEADLKRDLREAARENARLENELAAATQPINITVTRQDLEAASADTIARLRTETTKQWNDPYYLEGDDQ